MRDATPTRPNGERRALLRALLLAGGFGPVWMALARGAGAMSRTPIEPGVKEFEGDFRINGQPARLGQIVNPGDVATTGPGASAMLVIGRNAFLLRELSEIEFYPEHFQDDNGHVTGVVRMVSGAMLSAFGTGGTTISTPLANIGIRGTAAYVDSWPDRTYACVCYGSAELRSAATGQLLETVVTSYHDSPRYIFPPGAPQPITSAPVIDHTDAELRLIEGLVGGIPPFDTLNEGRGSDGGGGSY